MQNRFAILLLLFTVTMAVGVLTWHASDDDAAVEDLRLLFSTSTLYELKHFIPSIIIEPLSLVYGAVSLFAIILIVLVLRAVRRGALRDPKNR
ncbi:MAG TPA: hypothetical protein VIE89_36000 [Candidatus Binatia bacterium]|jgi:hypothetical protein